MKRHLLWCAWLPLLALAGARDDYARQWPLALQGDAGAYRVVLDPAVYRSAQSPALRDVDVLDASGAPVPSALFSADQPLAQLPRLVELPWFPLPPGPAAQAQDIAVISQRNADGSVSRVETRLAHAQPAATGTDAWLVDASALRAPIVALVLAWPQDAAPLQASYRVEGSDDLRTWQVLQPQAQLLDLVRDGRHLTQRRIALDAGAVADGTLDGSASTRSTKYLRLLPKAQGAAPAITGVHAELATPSAALPWHWATLSGHAVVEHGRTEYRYTLDRRFPVERADVALAGNNAGEWTLQSRDADDAPWRTRAGPWVAYRVGAAQRDRSAAQPLDGVARDRYWRLSSRTPVNAVPQLRLGYRPEVVVFVAQGSAPFTLVAGSGRALRAEAPVPQLVQALRTQHGSDWQPANALLGAPTVLAGDSALSPPPLRRDWKAWLLWSVLLAGVVIVAAFAASLLRKPAGA